jgi:hypothetical protein
LWVVFVMSNKPKPDRSGSENRQKQRRIIFRVDDQLAAKIDADAAAHELGVASYMRWLSDDNPARIRPRRRPLPAEILLTQLKGEAGRVDGNLAQFLRMANRGDTLPVDAIEDAARAVRDCWLHIIEMLKGPQ